MVIEVRRTEVGVDEANELLNQAGLPNLNSMEILQGGWDNTNILLTLIDASKVVLKVWNANTIEEVGRVVARHCQQRCPHDQTEMSVLHHNCQVTQLKE